MEGVPLALDMRRESHAGMLPQHALEQAFAVLERDVQQRPPVQVEEVERLVDEPGRTLLTEFRLEQAEVGTSVLIKGDDLPVDDRLLGFDPAWRADKVREVGLGVLEATGPGLDLAVVEDDLHAETVPLDLEQPVVVVEGLARQRGEHRFDVLRHRCRPGAGEVDLGGGGRRLADPDGLAVGFDLVVRSAGLDAPGVVLGIPAGLVGLVAFVNEQPLLTVVLLERARGRGAGTAAGAHDREATLQLLAVEHELQLAVAYRLLWVEGGRLGLPGAPVPDDDVAGAVLLGGDDSFEVEVLDRVVLDVDGHAPDLAVEGGALGDGPADENALDLEPEVVVEPRGSVALDDEPPGGAGQVRRRRFGGLAEVTLAAVFLEGHAGSVPAEAGRRGPTGAARPAASVAGSTREDAYGRFPGRRGSIRSTNAA